MPSLEWTWLVVVGSGLMLVLSGCGGAPQEAATLTAVAAAMPREIHGWIADGGVESFDTESIFTYIDGHAEVYLAYGMRGCAARRWDGPAGEPPIVIDVFELASPEDAFGVWSHDRAGEAVDVGRDAVLRHGWLSAWHGRFAVSGYAERDTPRARATLLALARAAVGAAGEGGQRPGIVGDLPRDRVDLGSACFLRHHVVLGAHGLADYGNALGLGPETAAVVAAAPDAGPGARVLLVDYPDARRASEALARTLAMRSPGIGPGQAGPDDGGGFAAGAAAGRRLALVVGAVSGEAALELLARASPGGE